MDEARPGADRVEIKSASARPLTTSKAGAIFLMLEDIMVELAEKDIDRISEGDGGAELNMIQLQSLISLRQTALQMTMNILQHMPKASSITSVEQNNDQAPQGQS
jgi:hypothetical protein